MRYTLSTLAFLLSLFTVGFLRKISVCVCVYERCACVCVRTFVRSCVHV